jgi:hypothetical protein
VERVRRFPATLHERETDTLRVAATIGLGYVPVLCGERAE